MDEIVRMLEIQWLFNRDEREPYFQYAPELTEKTEWGWVLTFFARDVPPDYSDSLVDRYIYHLESGLSQIVGTKGVEHAYRSILQAIEGNYPPRIRFSNEVIARLRMGTRIEDSTG